TSITRPQFLEFEDRGGIIPAHTVGVWTTGVLAAGADKFTYDIYGGNSQRIDLVGGAPQTGELNPNMAAATNHKGAAGFNLGYVPAAVEGLKIGLHGYIATIDDDAVPPNSTRLRFAGGYFAYLGNDWEILGEYYGFSNVDQSGGSGTHRSNAGYVQVGRLLFGKWTPYARGEKTSLDQTDAYCAQQAGGGSYDRAVAGLRYDLDPRAALKLEVNHTRFTDRIVSSFSEVRVQWAIRF